MLNNVCLAHCTNKQVHWQQVTMTGYKRGVLERHSCSQAWWVKGHHFVKLISYKWYCLIDSGTLVGNHLVCKWLLYILFLFVLQCPSIWKSGLPSWTKTHLMTTGFRSVSYPHTLATSVWIFNSSVNPTDSSMARCDRGCAMPLVLFKRPSIWIPACIHTLSPIKWEWVVNASNV